MVFKLVKPTILPLIFIVDLLLFPMFHIGPLSIKPSYVILAGWVIVTLIANQKLDRSFLDLTFTFGGIIICSLFGEIWMDMNFPQMDHSETLWSIEIYLLAILSYGYATTVKLFNFEHLITILFWACTINLLIIFFNNSIPSLSNFYYSQRSANDLGVADVGEIMNMLRPRGIFGNPNTSMLQINIIFLFIVLAIKKQLIEKPKWFIITPLILLPVSLAIIMGSRSELLVSGFYSISLSWYIWGRKSIIYIVSISLLFSVIIFAVSSFLENSTGFSKGDTIQYAFDRLTKTGNEFLSAEEKEQGVSRPLVMLEYAKGRLFLSPIFGAGYNAVLDTFPFNESPRYFHNDWLRIIATSGLIGLILFIRIIYKYAYKINFLLVVPFFLPGVTNTFLLSIPTLMFFFFMLAVFRKVLASPEHKKKMTLSTVALKS